MLRALRVRRRVLTQLQSSFVQQTRDVSLAGATVRFVSTDGAPERSEKEEYRRLLARVDKIEWQDASFSELLPSHLFGKLPSLGIENPTPVQASSIGTLIKGDSDVLIQAVTGALGESGPLARTAAAPFSTRRQHGTCSYPPTRAALARPPFLIPGSGKTLAYLLPLMTRIDNTSEHLQAVVLSPTRELAVQVPPRFARRRNAEPDLGPPALKSHHIRIAAAAPDLRALREGATALRFA